MSEKKIIEKIWANDLEQAKRFILSRLKYERNEETVMEIFVDSLIYLQDNFSQRDEIKPNYEEAIKYLYGTLKGKVKSFNFNTYVENLDRADVSSLNDEGEEMYTEDERISSRMSGIDILPPSYYFLKKYRRDLYRKNNPDWKEKKLIRLLHRFNNSIWRQIYYERQRIKLRSSPEYRAKLVTNILHSLNQEVWDKIKHERKWFWLQEYRKLPKVKDYIRTYEKQYRQRERYKEWNREYQKKKRQEDPERYKQYSRNHYWKNPEESRKKHREWAKSPERKKKDKERRMNKYYEIKKDPVKWKQHLYEINERKKRLRREKKLGIWKDRRFATNQ